MSEQPYVVLDADPLERVVDVDDFSETCGVLVTPPVDEWAEEDDPGEPSGKVCRIRSIDDRKAAPKR